MIRFTFRWLFRGLVLAIVLVTALLLLKDTLLREWLLHRVRRVTGLDTRLGHVETSLATGWITLQDLQVFNSADFGGSPLLSLPELHLELDRDALFRREFRIRLARVHLTDFSVVRNARGETNIFQLLRHAETHANAADAAIVSPPGLEFTGVDTLNLTLGTVHLVDLAQPARNRDIQVRLTNEVLRNVRSSADFNPLVLRVLVREMSESLGRGRGLAPAAPAAPPPRPAPTLRRSSP